MVSAVEPAQKMRPLRCFFLAFDNSKTQLEKKRRPRKGQIRKKPQIRGGNFSIKVGLLRYFSLAFDNSKTQLIKTRFKLKFSKS